MLAMACSKIWDKDLHQKMENAFQQKILFVTNKDELTFENLKKNHVTKIFFPHWSFIIKKEIYENFECIIFHMTDLPFGRGGSPLQNLISRGIYKTKISALKCEAGIDTGPIYLKRDFSLDGNARNIFQRATEMIFEMILEIETKSLVPVPQEGVVVDFKRRNPEESNIENLQNIVQVYDYIRMLDADGYPNAFLKNQKMKFEFYNARLLNDEVVAEVRIKYE